MRNLIKEFYCKLDSKKIEINWNKKPILIDTFLSFITVPTEVSTDHLGYSNGWTLRINKEHKLFIKGGIVGGKNYLNDIQYGTKMSNEYNNYVNPLFLMDIMTEEGIAFFYEYYKEDILSLLEKQTNEVKWLKTKLANALLLKARLKEEIDWLNSGQAIDKTT
jgi:hypothetical protein